MTDETSAPQCAPVRPGAQSPHRATTAPLRPPLKRGAVQSRWARSGSTQTDAEPGAHSHGEPTAPGEGLMAEPPTPPWADPAPAGWSDLEREAALRRALLRGARHSKPGHAHVRVAERVQIARRIHEAAARGAEPEEET